MAERRSPRDAGQLVPVSAWVSLENQQIKCRQHTNIPPVGLESTARAHFSSMSTTGEQEGSPELKGSQAPGKQQGGRLFGDTAGRGKLPKVSLPRSVAVEVACESLSPCSVHTSPPHPPRLPHAWAPRAPIPVLQDPGWGCRGRKGPLHLHPLSCPEPVRGLWDGGGCIGDAEATRAGAG